MAELTAELTVETDPADVGLDGERLSRIDRHFARYVDDGRLAGWLAVVARRGRIAHIGMSGQRDRESGAPVGVDTLWRIYSMTKPITSVAAMILVEEGRLELTDPIARFLPEFAAPRVFSAGSGTNPATTAAVEPIRVWHLLTHTSGLTYGFHHAHPVDEVYRRHGFEWGVPKGMDLAGACAAWAELPLVFQPGTEWNYGVSTDVLGRLVEVVSGQRLDAFLAERVLGPLGMTETSFGVPAGSPEAERLATLYGPHPGTGELRRLEAMGAAAVGERAMLSGGGGLVSSAADYHRFVQMLLRGGELDGVRVLGERTVAYMGLNHLPGGADLARCGRKIFSESPMDGMGFGLGFSVVLDPAATKVLSSPGELAWGGAASTTFWVDPVEDLTALFFTQLLPSSTHPIRSQLRTLVYQAVID